MMVNGNISDISTGDSLAGASIVIVDNNGNALGGGTAADSQGNFMISSPVLDTGGKLLISNVGYLSVIADPSVFNERGGLGLSVDPQSLAAVTVTAQKKTNNVTPLLIGGAVLGLLALSNDKKEKKISGEPVDWQKIAITGGLLVGGYFVGKAILTKLGILSSQTPQDKKTTDAQAAALAAAKAAAANSGSTAETYTIDQYTGWANDIYNLGVSDTPVSQTNQDAMKWDVIQANTLVDLQQLIVAFGTRNTKGPFGSLCNLIGYGCPSWDLPAFLKQTLDTDHINSINSYLSAQGINYTF